MHKKHRVGDFCQLCAQHTRPRAVQQRGRQRQQDKNSGTGECAGDLAVKAAGGGSTCQQRRRQDVLRTLRHNQKGHAEKKFRDMHCDQTRIPAQQMDWNTHRKGDAPGQPDISAQRPLQQREQQIQKQDAAEEPLSHAGKIHTDPARCHGKVIQPKEGQHQRDRL